MQDVSLIVPTYNEADGIRRHLEYHTRHFSPAEIVVVDGGSTDQTRNAVVQANAEVKFIHLSPANRSRQLAEGVRVSNTTYLLFLHADTYLPRRFNLENVASFEENWGWFDCGFDEELPRFRLLSTMISLRSAFFSSPTGDQALWVHRNLLRDIDGIPEQPLMEDVELSRQLRRTEPGRRIDQPVTTSARRWKESGYLKTIITMWSLKVAYYAGVSPDKLARIYYGRTET